MLNNLWVIMPVFNEEVCVENVVKEWMPVLKKHCNDFVFLALNDGSKDNTVSILRKIESEEKQFRIIDKPNSGHGQTCIDGYKFALQNGAEWVFQIDSDGQCEPKYFEQLTQKTETSKVVYGFRKSRDDGFQRYLVSRIVSVFALFATGVWVRDANVPYRLMHKDALADIVNKIPKDFHLANILISVLQQKYFGISWVNIHFRERMGGVPSVKTFTFAKHGFKLFRQLKNSMNN